jgi:hypothetical protein
MRGAAVGFDCPHGFQRALGIDVGNHYFGTSASETARGGLADARRAARD